MKAVNMFHSYQHPTEGTLRMPGIPAAYSRTPAAISFSLSPK